MHVLILNFTLSGGRQNTLHVLVFLKTRTCNDISESPRLNCGSVPPGNTLHVLVFLRTRTCNVYFKSRPVYFSPLHCQYKALEHSNQQQHRYGTRSVNNKPSHPFNESASMITGPTHRNTIKGNFHQDLITTSPPNPTAQYN